MAYLLLSLFVVSAISFYISLKLPRDKDFDKVVLFFPFTVAFHALYVFMHTILSLPAYVDTAFPFGLIYGPIFYFAIKTVVGKKIVSRDLLVHFSPFLLWAILFFAFLFFTRLRTSYYELYHFVLYSLTSFSLIGYVVKAFLISKRKLREFQSSQRTLRLVTIGVAILTTSGLFMLTLTFTNVSPGTTDYRLLPRTIIYTVMLAEVLAVLRYQVSRMATVLERTPTEIEKDSVPEVEEINEIHRYEKSLISDEIMDLYEKRLNELIKTKVFQDMELSLADLAKKIGAPKHHLTQLLNVRIQKSFSQFINGQRIDYACKLLIQKSKKYSIEELAYECGFNSKASFNRNFKKITGLTPSQYRNMHFQDVSI